MKKLIFVLFILMLQSTVAQTFLIDDSTNVSEIFMQHYFDIMSQNTDSTRLYAQIELKKEYDTPGDSFIIFVKVKNIGAHTARLTEINLKEIPEDWVIVSGPTKFIEEIGPGKTKTAKFYATRGNENTEIYASVKALNTITTTTQVIPVPISFLTIILVSFSLILITYIKK